MFVLPFSLFTLWHKMATGHEIATGDVVVEPVVEEIIEPMLDTCETEIHSEVPTLNFIETLKAKLPVYVVNCFLISGFDTQDVVATMDVSNQPGNSIEQIEQFITENKLYQDPKYVDEMIYHEKFAFPPGHRLRIVQFVTRLRDDLANVKHKKGYRRRSYGPMKKLDMDTVSTNLQRQLISWARKQDDNEYLKLLQEHKHYVINVMELGDTEETKRLKATIMCLLCNKVVLLYGKDRSFMLSNYTKHIKSCVRRNQAMLGPMVVHNEENPDGSHGTMVVQLPQLVTCDVVEESEAPQ